MRRNFTYTYSWILIIAIATCSSFAFATTFKITKKDTINYFLNSKKNKKKNPLAFTMPPMRPGIISTIRVNNIVRNDYKLLSNVEVYPNPITDQINLKYIISRNSNVSIKMMDILGNDVVTLFSQRVEPGERSFTYSLNNKLSKGFYFIRVVAGTESVIKRISIL